MNQTAGGGDKRRDHTKSHSGIESLYIPDHRFLFLSSRNFLTSRMFYFVRDKIQEGEDNTVKHSYSSITEVRSEPAPTLRRMEPRKRIEDYPLPTCHPKATSAKTFSIPRLHSFPV